MHLTRRAAAPATLAVVLLTLIPLGAGIAEAASTRWATNCGVNVRSHPTTAAAKKIVLSTDTVVTVAAKVSGGSYSVHCRTSVSGTGWFAITAIGGRSVSSLFGVSYLYAASGLFRGVAAGHVDGVDISHWQGAVDFGRVRASGKKFVIAKATEGRTNTDPKYAHNRAAAIGAGLKFGAYHFAHPDGSYHDAILEADHFLSVAALRHGMLRPTLDLERTGGLSTTRLQSWVRAWVARVYARTGARAMIYTTPSFWHSYMGNTRWFADNGYRIVWVAHWRVSSPSVPASNWGGRSWGFWQYSNCGSVPGISGCVDLDRFHGSDLSKASF